MKALKRKSKTIKPEWRPYKGNGYKVEKDFEVNLDKLSPAARFLAEGIYSTNNSDDLSNIRVYGDTRTFER